VLSWSNYVALGDSLTAGRDDHGPGGARIGWAQRLAGILSTRTAAPCALINLASDGARSCRCPAGLVAPARQRMREASDTIREQAAARGVLCLDAWSMPAAADPDLFGPDRIHPNASGHRLMAALCADLLLAG
jgi:lysophospholipase L1-like esterase